MSFSFSSSNHILTKPHRLESQNTRAVIIDDERLARRVLKNLILRHCPNIEVVEEGANCEDGINIITNHLPDIVFLDIEMPDGTGFDVLQNTKEFNYRTILTTAYSTYQEQISNFKITDILLKPVSHTDLKMILKRSVAPTTNLKNY